MARRSNRDAWGVLAVVAAVGGLVVLSVVVTFGLDRFDSTEPPPATTLAVGDSVTYYSAGQLVERFRPARLDFIAKFGYRTDEILPLLRTWLATDDRRPGGPLADHARVAVLAGYNDVLQHRGDRDADALDAMVSASSRFRCAVWFELPTRPGGRPSADPALSPRATAAWNDELRAAVARHPGVHLSSAWRDAVDGSGGAHLLVADGIHPSPAGSRRLALAYHRTLDRTCP